MLGIRPLRISSMVLFFVRVKEKSDGVGFKDS